MITDSDIREKVTASTVGFGDDINVDAVADQIIGTYGLVDVEAIPLAEYWAIVQEHDASQG